MSMPDGQPVPDADAPPQSAPTHWGRVTNAISHGVSTMFAPG